MPPRAIGPYYILSVLGTGGIGCVYRALDQRSQEQVALKLLSSGPALDPVATRRMAREFEALADLSHPNVVKVFDAGVFQGYPFLTMELVEGLTLREYLSIDPYSSIFSTPNEADLSDESSGADLPSDQKSSISTFDLNKLAEEPDSNLDLFSSVDHISGRGPDALRRLANAIDEPFTGDESSDGKGIPWSGEPLVPAQAPVRKVREPDLKEINRPERIALLKDALMQICDALAYVHGHGMVHRDLKPSNIMVDEDRRVRLMDFGLAKFLAEASAVTAAGRIVGTYRYMAPEQLMGENVDGRCDLYSLGVMLYELLAGRPAYDARTPLELCKDILEHEAQQLSLINPQVDEQLSRIAHRLMLKDPSERYQTAEEVCEVIFE